jgi:hypothetical protein
MLLNLSNHPSATWSEAQLASAKSIYKEVTDLPFPNIPAGYSKEEVLALVDEYAVKVLETGAEAVHLMGEMTFTHNLVERLHAQGIPCIASASERTVLEEADGKKTVVFNFVRFRGY